MINNIDEVLNLTNEELYELIKSDNNIDVDLTLNELSSAESFNEELHEPIKFDSNIDVDSTLNELNSVESLNKNSPIELSPNLKVPYPLKKISLKKIRILVLRIICKIYKENPKIGDKDLIDAVIAALGIKGDWLIALIMLLIKAGLKNICSWSF